LSFVEGFGIEGHRVPFIVFPFLREDCSCGIIRRVGFE
jgi:hypothetical protein